MDKAERDRKRIERRNKLWEENGWKIQVPSNTLSSEDRAPLGGGLRCFGLVYPRDDFGNKIKTSEKFRCKNPAKKGTLWCKKHGGGNQNALVHGNRSITNSLYRCAFKNDLGTLFDKFVNDPSIYDIKPELAALRTCTTKFLEELNREKTKKESKELIKTIKDMVGSSMMNNSEKFLAIRDFCLQQSSITDGESIDRLMHLVDTISKVIDRINRTQNKDEFIMTPDGLKVLLRSVVDILKNNIEENILEKIKEELITISVRTRGDLSKYSEDAKVLKVV